MWSQLPSELRLAVADVLAVDSSSLLALASVDRATYRACLPATFRNVRLDNLASLQQFLTNVPREYGRYIHRLSLCSDESQSITTDAVISLLSTTPCLKDLTLRINGSLAYSTTLVECFAALKDVESFNIGNVSEESVRPLSERLIVTLCAALPSLAHLSLDRISRSTLHASELIGAYPHVPLVMNDSDIPSHPLFSSSLSLPSLLSLPTLRSLTIRDTHLGDSLWSAPPAGIQCQLEKLDLGAYPQCSEEENGEWVQTIMGAISSGCSTSSSSLVSLSLTTSLSASALPAPSLSPSPKPSNSDVSTPRFALPHLRTLALTPFFPIDGIVETFSNLISSPIESVEVQCYEDDVVDVCETLEQFIQTIPQKEGETQTSFFNRLQRIDIVSVKDQDADSMYSNPDDDGEEEERLSAIRRLQKTCREAKLASSVSKAKWSRELAGLDLGTVEDYFVTPKWAVDGRVRSNTI